MAFQWWHLCGACWGFRGSRHIAGEHGSRRSVRIALNSQYNVEFGIARLKGIL